MHSKFRYIPYLTILVVSVLFYNCARKPSISVVCERSAVDTYILKWEIYPDYGDMPVEIYMSDNDTVFPQEPLLVANSDNYIAVIRDSTMQLKRKYFRLKVMEEFSGVVSNRFFLLDNVQNFRDMGGYYTSDNKQIRWGKVFRSGALLFMTEADDEKLTALQIKTILDIQPQDIRDTIGYVDENYIRIPISTRGYRTISSMIAGGRFLRGDAVVFTQDAYKSFIDKYTGQYTQFLNYFLDESNYPIMFNCSLGKDQTGLGAYFLLRALDVPAEEAEEDYMMSNEGVDIRKLRIKVDSLSEPMQEALTMITRTDISSLKYAISEMRKKSGSVDAYMEKELGFDRHKRERLRKILLY